MLLVLKLNCALIIRLSRSVLVYLGCCNTIPKNRWLLNSRNVLATTLEAVSPRAVPGAWTAAFSCVLTWQRGERAVQGLFISTLTSFRNS